MGHVYPEKRRQTRELARRVILSEEERFGATLRQGQRVPRRGARPRSRATCWPGEPRLHPARHVRLSGRGHPARAAAASAASRWTSRASAAAWSAQRERARAANTKDAEAAWTTYGGVTTHILEAAGPTRVGLGYAAVAKAACARRAGPRQGRPAGRRAWKRARSGARRAGRARLVYAENGRPESATRAPSAPMAGVVVAVLGTTVAPEKGLIRDVPAR